MTGGQIQSIRNLLCCVIGVLVDGMFLWSYSGMRCNTRLGSAGAIGAVVSNSPFKFQKSRAFFLAECVYDLDILGP